MAAVVGGAADAAIGRYSDFDCADFASDEYQDSPRRYLACSDNTFMEDDAVAGYGIVQMVAQAVEAVGDDPAAIAEYLHSETFDLPGYPFDDELDGVGRDGRRPAAVLGDRPGPGARGRQRGRRLVSRDADRCRSHSSRTSRLRLSTDANVPILELDGVEKRFGGLRQSTA